MSGEEVDDDVVMVNPIYNDLDINNDLDTKYFYFYFINEE